jgi:hypothetical protein
VYHYRISKRLWRESSAGQQTIIKPNRDRRTGTLARDHGRPWQRSHTHGTQTGANPRGSTTSVSRSSWGIPRWTVTSRGEPNSPDHQIRPGRSCHRTADATPSPQVRSSVRQFNHGQERDRNCRQPASRPEFQARSSAHGQNRPARHGISLDVTDGP